MYGAVGQLFKALVVGDDDKSLAKLVPEVEEKLMQFRLVLSVETARRLIGKHHGRVVDKGASHSHALLLAARQLVGLMRGTFAQAHEVEQLFCALARFLTSLAGYERRNHDILQSRELWQQLVKLKHESDVLVAEVGELLG